MTSFEVFKNKEFGKLILLKINEKEFFIGRDIAFKLGYTDPNGAMRRNVSNENKETVMLSDLSIWKQLKKELDSTNSRGHQAKRVLLTENGVYELINAAKHPKGNKLKKWIKEILKTSEIEVDDNCNTSVILNNAETEIFSCAEFGNLTVLEIDNEPWFVGKEITEKLGYSNSTKALKDHIDTEDIKTLKFRDSNETLKLTLWNNGNFTDRSLINESGLYSLVLSSKLESSKRFKRWVTKEILPNIRKHGMYATEELLDNPDLLIATLTRYKEEKEKNKRLEQEKENLSNVIAEVTPKVKFSEEVLETNDTMTARQIAADYGLSAEKLNKILQKEKIQYKCNGQWILYQKYKNKGYEDYKTGVKYGHSFTQMVWTQKGRMFIHQIMTKKGYKTTNKINKLETENNQMEMNLGEQRKW